MRVRVQYDQLTDLKRTEPTRKIWFDREIRLKVKSVSFALERRIKAQMPVLYGRARASWGHWTPGDILQTGHGEGPGDAHWEEKDGGLTFEQGSNVEYIEGLNAGRSRKVMPGFLDMAEEWAQQQLNKEVDDVLRLW